MSDGPSALPRVPSTAGRLAVPVPEIAAFVPGAAVTFLEWDGPLDATTDRELDAFVGSRVAFDFTLAVPSAFPDGTAYVPPEPSLGFRQLAHHLHQQFRDRTPLAWGQGLVPHLPLPTEDGPRQGVLDRLPLTAQAREVVLLDGSEVLGRWAFGTSAA